MADEWDELYRKWGAPMQAKKKRFYSRKAAIALFSILLIFAASSFIISNNLKFAASSNLNIAIIEFVDENNTRASFYQEFYCDENRCSFKGSDSKYAEDSFSWCASNCRIENKSFFEIFNNPEGITNIYPIGKNEPFFSYPSVYKIKEFYEREAKKYGVSLTINLDVKGYYFIKDKPPRLHNESPDKLKKFFDNEAKKQNIDISKYDVVNYAYFSNIEEGAYFITFGSNIDGKKTFNQLYISSDAIFVGISTIAHEMGHAFGAGDSYIPSTGGSCEYPEGYAEPYKKPLYPQNYACLMCKTIMLDDVNNKKTSTNFDELVVCDYEAKGFRWK